METIGILFSLAFGLVVGYGLRWFQVDREGHERKLDIQKLDSKKELIDQQLHRMTEDLRSLERMLGETEKNRSEQYGQLGEHLQIVGQKATELSVTTGNLNQTLNSSRVRGQWGERLAEDILGMMGLQEGVSYSKQVATPGKSRPDFTFMLPNNLAVNMDVKFPWDNYKRFVEASAEVDKDKFRKGFLRDVRQRVKEISEREYINEHTVDCVLLFIPNEHIL
jgi:DNA recombination protein RmuC